MLYVIAILLFLILWVLAPSLVFWLLGIAVVLGLGFGALVILGHIFDAFDRAKQ
jgi:hypothetical protein